ncbi:MAG: hypothetical protein LBC65_02045 [Oscillospiraceae bacterium]|jgi:hypothetical protein|nr:hypothetical protein [Oscillospiraceae bacterium]
MTKQSTYDREEYGYEDAAVETMARTRRNTSAPADSARRSKRHAAVRRKPLTPVGVLCVLGCAALILMWLYAQITLTDITTQNSGLRNSYVAASEESSRLKLAYENAFNLTVIEREATAKFGMRKMTELQVVYVGATSDDAVVLLQGAPAEDEGFLGAITDILRKSSEYISERW